MGVVGEDSGSAPSSSWWDVRAFVSRQLDLGDCESKPLFEHVSISQSARVLACSAVQRRVLDAQRGLVT